MKKEVQRLKRKMHIRKKVSGTDEKPRIFVFKSNMYLHAGVANDDAGKVLFGNSQKRNTKGAQTLGDEIAKQLKTKKLEVAVFDRSGYKYHGIIAAFVEQLRKNGIKI
jgi:large subunit ribosomal protein L18